MIGSKLVRTKRMSLRWLRNILDQKTRDEATSKEQSKFFVTTSRRTAFRRLHLTGCFVKPSNCTEVRMLDEVTNEDFDSICRACKRKMLAENGKDVNPESSSTASSSSTGSADGRPQAKLPTCLPKEQCQACRQWVSDLCLFQLSLPAGCFEKFVLILRDSVYLSRSEMGEDLSQVCALKYLGRHC